MACRRSKSGSSTPGNSLASLRTGTDWVWTSEARAFYDLERLWRDGRRLDTDKMIRQAGGTKAGGGR